MERIKAIIHEYSIVPAAESAVAVILVYAAIRAALLKKRPPKPFHVEAARALLVGYIAALVNIVWVSADILFGDRSAWKYYFFGGGYVHNYEIFRCLFLEKNGLAALLQDFEMLANIALFVPLGFLLPIAFKRLRWWQTDLICLGATCLVELVQPLFGRSGDLDDVITNALGGVIGCALAKLLSAVFGRKRGKESSFVKNGKRVLKALPVIMLGIVGAWLVISSLIGIVKPISGSSTFDVGDRVEVNPEYGVPLFSRKHVIGFDEYYYAVFSHNDSCALIVRADKDWAECFDPENGRARMHICTRGTVKEFYMTPMERHIEWRELDEFGDYGLRSDVYIDLDFLARRQYMIRLVVGGVCVAACIVLTVIFAGKRKVGRNERAEL